MENKYYHGVAGGISSLTEEEILNESLKVLKSIFIYKGIYCRNILRMYNIEVSDYKNSAYNGDDYISVCMNNLPAQDWEPFEESSFFFYARSKIAIEFKPDIEKKSIFRNLPYKHLPAERQIYQSIDISNFNRILIGLQTKEIVDKAIIEISKICKSYQIPVMTFEEAEYLDTQQKILIR